MKGKDWRPSLSIPKLLLLMKTNFYLVDLIYSNCVPIISMSSTVSFCLSTKIGWIIVRALILTYFDTWREKTSEWTDLKHERERLASFPFNT